MHLQEIVNRRSPPEPWAECDNIPWSDPGFSGKMLKEHLSQDHDVASRSFETIDRHVDWIQNNVLSARPSRILDLGCGPGLYLQGLARLGHECVGIDYSPASIAYAKDAAQRAGLPIQYVLEDIRRADFGGRFDLIIFIWGEFNAFSPRDARLVVTESVASLTDSGILLLEVHRFGAIRKRGKRAPSWHSAQSGLFSDTPHICLEENYWDAGKRATTTRYYVIDSTTARVAAHGSSLQAYTDEEYEQLLRNSGFAKVTKYLSLTGTQDEEQQDLMVLAAKK